MGLILPEGMGRSPLRNGLRGMPAEQDRLWKIEKGDFVGAVTEYNQEITGYSEGMAGLEGLKIGYSGSWFYVQGMLESKGYRVTHVEDRR